MNQKRYETTRPFRLENPSQYVGRDRKSNQYREYYPEDDAATCPLSQNNRNTSVCNSGRGHARSSAALMITESLSIISSQLLSAFAVSAGLNLYSSWRFLRPMSEQKSAQLG